MNDDEPKQEQDRSPEAPRTDDFSILREAIDSVTVTGGQHKKWWQLKKSKLIAGLVIVVLLVAGVAAYALVSQRHQQQVASESGIHKIKHVVIIMQENRSFDSYFGTYPGADGIPMQNGVPTVCVHDPRTGQCVKPYHDTSDVNTGGPHGEANSKADV